MTHNTLEDLIEVLLGQARQGGMKQVMKEPNHWGGEAYGEEKAEHR